MQKNYRTKQLIRFRRWSRKAYAMFCSLGKQVTIGFLNKNVTEASLVKQQGGMFSAVCMQVEDDSDAWEEEDTGPLPDVFRKLSMLFQPQVAVGKVGCVVGLRESAIVRVYLVIAAGWILKDICPAFFIG